VRLERNVVEGNSVNPIMQLPAATSVKRVTGHSNHGRLLNMTPSSRQVFLTWQARKLSRRLNIDCMRLGASCQHGPVIGQKASLHHGALLSDWDMPILDTKLGPLTRLVPAWAKMEKAPVVGQIFIAASLSKVSTRSHTPE
jgi:hypothetical protein